MPIMPIRTLVMAGSLRMVVRNTSFSFRRFANDFFRAAIFAQAEERRLAQMTVSSPFGKANLAHELRLEPGAPPHFAAGHASIPRVHELFGQVGKGTGWPDEFSEFFVK